MQKLRPQYPYVLRAQRAGMFEPSIDMFWPSPPKMGLYHHQNCSPCFVTLNLSLLQRNKVKNNKDVCFGFCYDPLAGLGIVYLNDRCADRNGTRCK